MFCYAFHGGKTLFIRVGKKADCVTQRTGAPGMMGLYMLQKC